MKDHYSPPDELLATTESIIQCQGYENPVEEEIDVDKIVRNDHVFQNKELTKLESWFDNKIEETEVSRVASDVKPGKHIKQSMHL